MSNDHVQITRDGAVQVIRLNRPDKKNAITRAMYAEMTAALDAGEADDSIRVHVFLGHPEFFSSGNDLQDFMAAAMGGDLGQEVLAFLDRLATLAKPAVSGVSGLAIGIGTTIHMHCDLTYATPDAEFRTPFVDLALVPEAGSSLLAPAAMGYQRAYALLAAGEAFSGEEAARAGLIRATVSGEALEGEVMAAARRLAEKPPVALSLAKKLMKGDTGAVRERIVTEARHFAAQLKSDEARTAFMAFMARKKG